MVQVAQDLQRSDAPLYRLDAIDFGRRIAVDKEIEKTEGVPPPNAIFDESSNFLLYPTLLGIKVINLYSINFNRLGLSLVGWLQNFGKKDIDFVTSQC